VLWQKIFRLLRQLPTCLLQDPISIGILQQLLQLA